MIVGGGGVAALQRRSIAAKSDAALPLSDDPDGERKYKRRGAGGPL